jgi:hypothetical protein
VLVFVFELGGDFAVDDFLKDRFGHGEKLARESRESPRITQKQSSAV